MPPVAQNMPVEEQNMLAAEQAEPVEATQVAARIAARVAAFD